MSRPTTMVVPSKSLRLALGVICGPILAGFMEARSGNNVVRPGIDALKN
jgi:phosphoribulokinase